MADENKVELPESVTKALETLDKLASEIAELKKAKGDDTVNTVLTTDLESAQAELTRIETELSETRKMLRTELEERAKELEGTKAENVKLVKARRSERFIKLAHTLPSLPGTVADDFAERLDVIEKALGAKEFGKLYQQFVSWNTVIEKNNVLMKEIGREGGDFGMLSGPEAQIEALAREKLAKDSKLTIEKARTQVIEENPALYAKYRAEQANGRK